MVNEKHWFVFGKMKSPKATVSGSERGVELGNHFNFQIEYVWVGVWGRFFTHIQTELRAYLFYIFPHFLFALYVSYF